MKTAVRRVVAAAGICVCLGAVNTAGAQTLEPNTVEYLAKAKGCFDQACGVCHGLERSLSKTFDKEGWEKTVARMHDHGAEVSREEREQVVAYLLTKNIFEAKCSTCHETGQPLGKKKSAADWLATVNRMSGMQPGHLTASEEAGIAAYLSVVCPLP